MTDAKAKSGPGASLEERVGVFDSLATAVRDFPHSESYGALKTELILKATEFYKSQPKGTDGQLALGEKGAKDLANLLWNFAAQHVAKNYLHMSDKDIEAKKNGKDPASGKSNYETLMAGILGIDEDALYNNLKTRGTVSAEQISTLAAPLYETHDRVDTSKRTSKDIKDNKDGDAALGYIKQLKGLFPKALEGLTVPSTFTSVDEVKQLYATAVRAIPRDSPINVAATYRRAA